MLKNFFFVSKSYFYVIELHDQRLQQCGQCVHAVNTSAQVNM